MDVGGDGNAERLADFAEDPATFFDPRPTEGPHRGAVRFVEGGFENEMNPRAVRDFLERMGHFPRKRFTFKGAWAQDKKRSRAADGDIADVKGIEVHSDGIKLAVGGVQGG